MRKLKNRLAVLRLLLVLLFCAVAVYLAWLMQKPELLQAAAGQGSYTCTAGTAAGTIYDRNGVPLVNTRSVCTAVVSPTPEAAEALLPHVLDAEAFYEKLAQGKPFTCTVDTADIACPDVTVLEIPQRYTTPQPAQHVIGYTQEGKGVAGLESAYDAVLRGVDSQWSVTFSVDGKGKPLAGEAAQVRYGANPVQGVMTTLDIRMQRICETAGASLQKGCVVVMDVESGDILGLASFPGYTPDALGEAMQDPDSPMIQRALYAYPVGSIFKLVTAACAYENGAETAFQWNCNGVISIGSQRFRCHDPQGHGLQNLADAMRNSCNPYFIALGQTFSGKELLETAKALGFGTETVLTSNMIGSSGTLPTLQQLKLPAEQANFSFGQGVLTATPLQITRMTCAIAGNGTLPAVRLVRGVTENGRTVLREETGLSETGISADTAQFLRRKRRRSISAHLPAVSASAGTAHCHLRICHWTGQPPQHFTGTEHSGTAGQPMAHHQIRRHCRKLSADDVLYHGCRLDALLRVPVRFGKDHRRFRRRNVRLFLPHAGQSGTDDPVRRYCRCSLYRHLCSGTAKRH